MKKLLIILASINLSFTAKFFIKTTPFISMSINAQDFMFGTNTSDHSAGIYETNSPGSTHGNRRYQILLNKDEQHFRGRKIFYDSIGIKDFSISNANFMFFDKGTGELKSTGSINFLSFLTASLSIPLSHVTGTNVLSTGTISTGYGATIIGASPSQTIIIDTVAMMYTSKANAAIAAMTSSINNKQAQLSGTGFVKISGGSVNYDNSSYLITEIDGSISNEIQSMSISGQTINLSGSASVIIPTQTTALTSSQVTAALGANPLFSEVDGSTINELQTISGTGTATLTLSNSGGTWSPPSRMSYTISRSFNSSFTISATQDFRVDYSIYGQATSALAGTNTAEVYLELSTTSGGTYTTIAGGPIVSVAGVLSTNGGIICIGGFIPAGYWTRIRTAATGANSGAAVFTYKFGRENNN